jgi:hypothetical protein
MTTTCEDARKGAREAAGRVLDEIRPMTLPKQE